MPNSDAAAIGAENVGLGPFPQFAFDNSYARLPERFYQRVDPVPVRAPRLIQVNRAVAEVLNLDPEALATAEGVEILAGNRVAAGSEPLAMAYAGHQFGSFVPQLGDGRTNLLGEVVGRDGLRYDIQLKGSGQTPFSRRGDGRAALGPVLREYLVSEAMAALGIPTTRALAAVTTGEQLLRETVLPGAVLTRVARSHVRVGTFEYFAARRDTEAVRQLAEYALVRHYPESNGDAGACGELLRQVVASQARLVAQWMQVGFIHGVMNTDNCSIAGETIDYGPCAFMEAFDPDSVYSYIDSQGRYAFSNQPGIALWNLTRLADALLAGMELETGSREAAVAVATEALEGFAPIFEAAHLSGLRRKIGLEMEAAGDRELIEDLLRRMAVNQADFTLTFRRMCEAAGDDGDEAVRAMFRNPTAWDEWAVKWRLRLQAESASADERQSRMRRVNPAVIPRNHLVEAVIQAAVESQDFAPFAELLEAVSHPYDERPGVFLLPARPEERVRYTYCGT